MAVLGDFLGGLETGLRGSGAQGVQLTQLITRNQQAQAQLQNQEKQLQLQESQEKRQIAGQAFNMVTGLLSIQDPKRMGIAMNAMKDRLKSLGVEMGSLKTLQTIDPESRNMLIDYLKKRNVQDPEGTFDLFKNIFVGQSDLQRVQTIDKIAEGIDKARAMGLTGDSANMFIAQQFGDRGVFGPMKAVVGAKALKEGDFEATKLTEEISRSMFQGRKYNQLTSKEQQQVLNKRHRTNEGMLKAMTELRKEFNSLPIVKEMFDTGRKYLIMREALKVSRDPKTRSFIAIDQSLITLFGKILDPISVVREEEYKRTAMDQSLINRIRGKAIKVVKGGAGLTDVERQALVDMAGRYIVSARRIYGERMSQYGKLSDAYGGEREMVVTPPTDLLESAMKDIDIEKQFESAIDKAKRLDELKRN